MKKSELNQFIKEEVLKAMAEAVDTGAFRRLVITSPKYKLIQSGAEKYLTQNAYMYPDLTFKIMPSPKPNTFVIDLVGNKATVVGIKLQDLAERLDNTAIVLVRKEKKLGVKESIITEAEAPLYKDWNEFTNPDYIIVHLKDGRKLQINKKNVAGGQRVYQAILQAFSDDRTDITNKVVAAMSSMLGGTLNKESMNEGSMSDINLMAQEAKDFNSFVKEFMKEYSIDSGSTTKLKDWLQSIYDDAKSQNESLNEASVPNFSMSDYSKLSPREQQLHGDLSQVIFKYKNLKKEEKLNAVGGLLKRIESGDLSESTTESVITEATTKTILGVKFKMAPAPGNGIKFEFVDAKQFIKSGVSANEMVEEIQKMLDDKFGKDLFWFKPAGRMQYDTKVNGFEFRMNANQFFKDL